MKPPIHILHLEDCEEDSLLVKARLMADHINCVIVRVETQERFLQTLKNQDFDLILADCSLPQFSGLHALEFAKVMKPLIPFVFFSGTLGEEAAIESLCKGATDYVLKHHISKLAPAVRRGLKEAQERTLRMEMEQRLNRAQRLEAIGTLAGGIAHDFNNILTIIMGHNVLLKDQSNNPHKVLEIANTFEIAARRGAELVMQLLAFARKSEGHFSSVNLNLQVKVTIGMLKEALPRNLDFKVEFANDIPNILADPAQIQRVLINLATNARDAMPDGGTIHISTEKVDALEVLSLSPSPTASSYLRLRFADTGIGMDEATRKRIFEPFFTTKAIGKGTGLGLPVVYGLMQSHNGHVDIQSELGKGTVITLYFPVSEILPSVPDLETPVEESPVSGSEGILIVEDEPDVSYFIASILKSHGYKVFEAGTAAEAFAIFEVHQHEISLAFSDVGLPQLDGLIVCSRLKEINKNVKTVLSSGYPQANYQARMKEHQVDGFIAKPFNARDVLHCLRSVLDRVS